MIAGIVTAALLLLFLVGCAWVYSPRRHAEFAVAERLALDERQPAAITPSEETLP